MLNFNFQLFSWIRRCWKNSLFFFIVVSDSPDDVDWQQNKYAEDGVERHEADHVSLKVQVLHGIRVDLVTEVTHVQSQGQLDPTEQTVLVFVRNLHPTLFQHIFYNQRE